MARLVTASMDMLFSFQRVAPFFLSLFVLAGCEGVGSEVGPCDVVRESSILTIAEVTAPPSGTSLDTIALTDFVVDGDSLPVEFLDPEDGRNAVAEGDTLRCTVPCAFGRRQGTYTFTATSPGYVPTRVRLSEVQYPIEEQEGPCPRIIYSGTNEVQIELTEE